MLAYSIIVEIRIGRILVRPSSLRWTYRAAAGSTEHPAPGPIEPPLDPPNTRWTHRASAEPTEYPLDPSRRNGAALFWRIYLALWVRSESGVRRGGHLVKGRDRGIELANLWTPLDSCPEETPPSMISHDRENWTSQAQAGILRSVKSITLKG